MTTEVTDAVDVAAYFDRIGYRGPAEPTVETVHALVAAHNRSIPFETSTRCWASPSRTSAPPRLPTSWCPAAAAATATSTTD